MLGLFPTAIFTNHHSSDGRLLTPRLWSSLNGATLMPDQAETPLILVEDFRPFGASAAVAANVGRYVGNAGQYRSYEDTGDAIAQIATNYQGEITFTTAATDNNESWLQPGAAASVVCKIDTTAGQNKKLIFETRWKTSQVTNTYNSFVGLAEEGSAAADFITDAGAMADKDWIGFHVLEAAGATLKFGYKKAGQAAQTVLTWGTALAADTWYNLGFVYDPLAPATQRIKIFINGTEQTTYVTGTNIAAATFPNGEELAPVFGIKNQAAASKVVSLDGWALYQGG